MIAKIWKRPTCPPVDEWMKKTHTWRVQYYSALKKKEILPFVTTWMNLEDIILSETNHTHTQNKYRMISVMCVESKIVKLMKAENRMVVARGVGLGGGVRCWRKDAVSPMRDKEVRET